MAWGSHAARWGPAAVPPRPRWRHRGPPPALGRGPRCVLIPDVEGATVTWQSDVPLRSLRPENRPGLCGIQRLLLGSPGRGSLEMQGLLLECVLSPAPLQTRVWHRHRLLGAHPLSQRFLPLGTKAVRPHSGANGNQKTQTQTPVRAWPEQRRLWGPWLCLPALPLGLPPPALPRRARERPRCSQEGRRPRARGSERTRKGHPGTGKERP